MNYGIFGDKFFIDEKEIGNIFPKGTSVAWHCPWYMGTSHRDYEISNCDYYVNLWKSHLNQVEMINSEIFPEGFYFDFYDVEFKENGLLGIYKKDNILKSTAIFFIGYTSWDYDFSLKEFLNDFPLYAKDKDCNLISEEFGIVVLITVSIENDISLEKLRSKLDNRYEELLVDFLEINTIKNEISFSPEHLSTGSSILQYFGKLLQEKYPNEKVSVSIKQEGLKVTMSIETPDGKKEEVEEYLNQYGLVISNQITPQEFTSNPIQILELEIKLESAKVEIGFQKKLLALQDKTYDENLVSLKDEVGFLRNELSALRTTNNEQITLLLSSLLTKDKLIKQLAKSVDKRDKKETKQLLLELKEKDSKGYVSLKEHLDSVIVGNLTNTPAWLEFIKQLF